MPARNRSSLTEREAVARLSPESPRVRALRAGVDVARAEASAAARWPNPRLTIDRESVAGSHRVPDDGVAAAADVGPPRLRHAGRRRTGLSQLGTRRRRRAPLRADLRLAFADLQWAQVRERELTTVRDRLNELAAVLGRREAAGDAAGYDRLRAEREVLNVGCGPRHGVDRSRAVRRPA